MLVENGIYDGFLGKRLVGLGCGVIVWLKVIDVEAEDVPVLDGVGNGVGVQLLLKQLFGGSQGSGFVFDLLGSGVFFEDRGASEAKKLGVGEKLLDSLVVLAEL